MMTFVSLPPAFERCLLPAGSGDNFQPYFLTYWQVFLHP